jgi:hypothetical protein
MYLVNSFRGSRYAFACEIVGLDSGLNGCDLLLGGVIALCSCHVWEMVSTRDLHSRYPHG